MKMTQSLVGDSGALSSFSARKVYKPTLVGEVLAEKSAPFSIHFWPTSDSRLRVTHLNLGTLTSTESCLDSLDLTLDGEAERLSKGDIDI